MIYIWCLSKKEQSSDISVFHNRVNFKTASGVPGSGPWTEQEFSWLNRKFHSNQPGTCLEHLETKT